MYAGRERGLAAKNRSPDTVTAMRAVICREAGGPEVLSIGDVPEPRPQPGEIVIDIAASAVNRADLLQRQGRYTPPPGASDILGLECAGTVSAVGDEVERWNVGDRVCALLSGGGYADQVAVPAGHVLPVPDDLDLIEAGALPEVLTTVWSNVFMIAALQPRELLLVHGGGGGIGTMAIQLAHALGARVATTVGSREKAAACSALGADLVINYREQDFVEEVMRLTDKRGVDVVLDMVGGDYIPRNYDAAAQDGRIVQIAFLQGPKVEVDFRRLMVKRLTHTGSTLRPRSVSEKAAIARALEDRVWPLLAEGRCRPVMDSTFALEDVARAHARMDGGEHIGKIVLSL
jgi:NADPH2:quinone reductase